MSTLRPLSAILISLSSFAGCARDSTSTVEAPQSGGGAITPSQARAAKAYLEITLKVEPTNRAAAAGIYAKYRQPFLDTVPGAVSKQLLVRDEDVVVLHGFDSTQQASDYLNSQLFTNDVVVALKPLLSASPDVRIYATP